MLDAKTRKAAVIAAVITPSVASLSLMIFILVAGIVDGDIPSFGQLFFMPFMTFVVGWIMSITLCFAVGVPIHLTLNHLGLTSILWYVGIGAVLTFGTMLYATGYPHLENTETFFIIVATCIAFGGPIAAATFWWIARPDQPLSDI